MKAVDASTSAMPVVKTLIKKELAADGDVAKANHALR